jgi:hypothetical protein
MPLMRQRIPKKLEFETASTSIGASSAMPTDCRKRFIAYDLARRAEARQAGQEEPEEPGLRPPPSNDPASTIHFYQLRREN